MAEDDDPWSAKRFVFFVTDVTLLMSRPALIEEAMQISNAIRTLFGWELHGRSRVQNTTARDFTEHH